MSVYWNAKILYNPGRLFTHLFMKKFLFLFFGFAAFSLFSIPTTSAVVLTVAENVVMTENILDDVYVVAGNANIEADIFGDLYIGGGSVVINGNIQEDLVVGGGKVTVVGNVFGDLRVVGGQVAVYGNVGDDVVVAGGQLDIGKKSVINGSLVAGAGILTLDGEVKEDVRGGMGILLLNGTVGKDVIVTIEDQLSVSKSAKILGNLKYSALIESEIPKGVVKGETSFNKFEKETLLETVTYMFFAEKVVSYLSALILLAICIFIFPKMLLRGAAITKENILRSFGVGLLTLIVAGIGSILLMLTVVGIPFAIIILALLLIVFYISNIFVSVWIASYVANRKKVPPTKLKLFLWSALALLVYYLVNMIPFAGWFLNLVLFVIGVGTLVLLKKEVYFFLRSKKVV